MPTVTRRAKPLNVPASWLPHLATPLPTVSAVWVTRSYSDPLYGSHGQIVVDWKNGDRTVYQCSAPINMGPPSEVVKGIRERHGDNRRRWAGEA